MYNVSSVNKMETVHGVQSEDDVVVCRCVFREQDSPGGGGGCGCAVCSSPVSVDCPVILDDWGTGEWTCSVHVHVYTIHSEQIVSKGISKQCVLALTCSSVSAKPHLLSCC